MNACELPQLVSSSHDRDLQESDVGDYTVYHRFNDKFTERTIKVSLDLKPEFERNSIYIGIGASVAVLVVILCVVCYCRRVDVLWLYKRYLGAYEKGSDRVTTLVSMQLYKMPCFFFKRESCMMLSWCIITRRTT